MFAGLGKGKPKFGEIRFRWDIAEDAKALHCRFRPVFGGEFGSLLLGTPVGGVDAFQAVFFDQMTKEGGNGGVARVRQDHAEGRQLEVEDGSTVVAKAFVHDGNVG